MKLKKTGNLPHFKNQNNSEVGHIYLQGGKILLVLKVIRPIEILR